jgi:hypothetical protein
MSNPFAIVSASHPASAGLAARVLRLAIGSGTTTTTTTVTGRQPARD